MSQPSTKIENTSKIKPSWVAPSFGAFESSVTEQSSFKRPAAKRVKVDDHNKTSRKARSTQAATLSRASSCEDPRLSWVDKYSPQTRTDLAIHPKKVDDVYAWLRTALKSAASGPMLVLTGPAGTGKSATLRVAAREMGFLLREWITPLDKNLYSEDEEGNKKFLYGYESELDRVREFVLRSSRYPSVLQGEENLPSIVLIEDLPNCFSRDPANLHSLLQEYREGGRAPLVLVVGDNRMLRRLLPDQILARFNVKLIEFNPIAVTIMVKMLTSIVQAESQNVANKNFLSPARSDLEAIYESSCGDLRSAINTLQFTCLKGDISTRVRTSAVSPSKKVGTKKKKKDSKTDLAAVGGRDSSSDFFRTVGRVLYCSREKEEGSRGSLSHNPQDIVSACLSSAELTVGFLHENYPPHFPVLASLERAADYLCQADLIMNAWTGSERELSKKLGLSVAVHGLMFSHPDQAQRLGFRPLHKPRSIGAEKAYEERRERARSLFPTSHCNSHELLTEMVPYMGQIGAPACSSQAQLSFLESSRLDKTGPLLRMPAPNLTVQTQNARVEGDESMVIEEIDSD